MLLHAPRYGENIIIDPGHVDIFPASRIPRPIQHLLKPIYRMKSGVSKEALGSLDDEQEKGFRIITEPHTLSSVLQWTADDQVAFIFWIEEINNTFLHLNKVGACTGGEISVSGARFWQITLFSYDIICSL